MLRFFGSRDCNASIWESVSITLPSFDHCCHHRSITNASRSTCLEILWNYHSTFCNPTIQPPPQTAFIEQSELFTHQWHDICFLLNHIAGCGDMSLVIPKFDIRIWTFYQDIYYPFAWIYKSKWVFPPIENIVCFIYTYIRFFSLKKKGYNNM